MLQQRCALDIRRAIANSAMERAFITRSEPDAREAGRLAREHVRLNPRDGDGRRILAGTLFLCADRTTAEARKALLVEALAAAEAAPGKGPALLAIRGLAKERLAPGNGAEDLAAARRMNPRLHLLGPRPHWLRRARSTSARAQATFLSSPCLSAKY